MPLMLLVELNVHFVSEHLSNLDNFCVTTSLPQLMDVVRSNYEAMIDRHHGGPNFMMHSGISQASEYDDPPGLREKAEYLLREWVNLYHSAAAGRDSTKAFSAFVGQVSQFRVPQLGFLRLELACITSFTPALFFHRCTSRAS